ncbi:TPA: hypothetical protein JLO99_002745 [Escherichia coli]|nr:hypothetical protein [Escherichia coli]
MTDQLRFKEIREDNKSSIVEVIRKQNKKHLTMLIKNDVLIAERCITATGTTYRSPEVE